MSIVFPLFLENSPWPATRFGKKQCPKQKYSKLLGEGISLHKLRQQKKLGKSSLRFPSTKQ